MMPRQSDLEKELEREIYSNRMLVLLEQEEGFVQVLLTPRGFKEVSDAIAKSFPLVRMDGENEVLDMRTTDEFIPLEHFEGLQDFYDDEA